MTIYCIIDPTGDVVPDTVSERAREAWTYAIVKIIQPVRAATSFRNDQAEMERDGYRLGRASGVVFERVG